jgi:hypothetical protein
MAELTQILESGDLNKIKLGGSGQKKRVVTRGEVEVTIAEHEHIVIETGYPLPSILDNLDCETAIPNPLVTQTYLLVASNANVFAVWWTGSIFTYIKIKVAL